MTTLANLLGFVVVGAFLAAVAVLWRAHVLGCRLTDHFLFYQARMRERGVTLEWEPAGSPDASPMEATFAFAGDGWAVRGQGVFKAWKLVRRIWRRDVTREELRAMGAASDAHAKRPPL